jgi:tetratricopeptide (TPR) repeat protein
MTEALRLLEPLRASNPSSCGAWSEFAALEKRLGDFEAASQDYLKAYELQPGNERWLHLAAMALVEGKQPDRALELVRAEAVKYPGRLDLAMGLGDIAKSTGHFDEALDAYRRMTSSANRQAQVAGYWELALLYASKSDWPNARDSVDHALEIQPSNQNLKTLRQRIDRQQQAAGK